MMSMLAQIEVGQQYVGLGEPFGIIGVIVASVIVIVALAVVFGTYVVLSNSMKKVKLIAPPKEERAALPAPAPNAVVSVADDEESAVAIAVVDEASAVAS